MPAEITLFRGKSEDANLGDVNLADANLGYANLSDVNLKS